MAGELFYSTSFTFILGFLMSSQIEKKCFVKIVAIGDSGVGKTSLI
jgi:GTPase SAR1 family protein